MVKLKKILNEIKMDEAAPRMRKDKGVEKLKTVRQIASGVENQIKTMDRSRYSHVKNDFNKFRKAMDNLINTLSRKGPTIPEGINEALPKFKTPFEAYSWIMDKRGEAMDIEQEMMDVNKEIQQLYGKMEQEAEAGGGPIADRYGEELEALEDHHKELRAEFQMVMAEIDEYDQN